MLASVLCLLFMTAEVVGGVLSNSLAVATDAAHLLTDLASFMVSLFALWLAGRPSTDKENIFVAVPKNIICISSVRPQMSFGWHRAEVVGALVSVLLIWVVTGVLVSVAALRLATGDTEVEPGVMLVTSGVSARPCAAVSKPSRNFRVSGEGPISCLYTYNV